MPCSTEMQLWVTLTVTRQTADTTNEATEASVALLLPCQSEEETRRTTAPLFMRSDTVN